LDPKFNSFTADRRVIYVSCTKSYACKQQHKDSEIVLPKTASKALNTIK